MLTHLVKFYIYNFNYWESDILYNFVLILSNDEQYLDFILIASYVYWGKTKAFAKPLTLTIVLKSPWKQSLDVYRIKPSSKKLFLCKNCDSKNIL